MILIEEKDETQIQDAAGWVLRTGVILSVSVMLLGLFLSLLKGIPSVAQMQTLSFSGNFTALGKGLLHLNPESIIGLGILLLVLTPILRVVVSMLLFFFVEKDWFYALVTLVVLALTVSSLLYLK